MVGHIWNHDGPPIPEDVRAFLSCIMPAGTHVQGYVFYEGECEISYIMSDGDPRPAYLNLYLPSSDHRPSMSRKTILAGLIVSALTLAVLLTACWLFAR